MLIEAQDQERGGSLFSLHSTGHPIHSWAVTIKRALDKLGCTIKRPLNAGEWILTESCMEQPRSTEHACPGFLGVGHDLKSEGEKWNPLGRR